VGENRERVGRRGGGWLFVCGVMEVHPWGHLEIWKGFLIIDWPEMRKRAQVARELG
jgi:hypothetical protein